MINKDTPIEIGQRWSGDDVRVSFLNHRFYINQEGDQAQAWSDVLTELGFTEITVTREY